MRELTPGQLVRFVLICIGWCASVGAALVLGAWALGLIVSDRWIWSQWLAWIPAVVALGAAGIGFLSAWRPAKPRKRRRRLIVWGAILMIATAYVAMIDYRPWRGPPHIPNHALTIVHWNAGPAERGDRTRAIELALDLDADIVILTDAHLLRWRRRATERLGETAHIAASTPFAFMSRLPILEVRPLVAVDEMYAVVLRLDATATVFDRELVILAIDLPSDLSLSRIETAQRMGALLDQAGSPHRSADVILGDFNITRGSASLSHLAPNMHHAWNEAGRGWSKTFPRSPALLHIDHIFINPHTLRSLDYETLDLGVARHRAQRVVIEGR